MLDAASIMTRKVITASPEDTVAEVARLLTKHNISALPVCDVSGKLLGMISEGDLMRPFGEANSLRRAWWLEMLAEGTDLAPEFLTYVRVDHRRVKDLMTNEVVTADQGANVETLADLLTRHHIKRVPIVHDGKLVGVVSRADVVRALAGGHDPVVQRD